MTGKQSNSKIQQRRDIVQGLKIFSRVSTAGDKPGQPPIVLVHGLSMSSAYMVPTAIRLAQTHTVYAPDLPGYGRSEKTKKIFTIVELAAFLEAWMNQMGLGEMVLVGNSLGCQIIVEHVLQYPGRACAVVLTGLTPDPLHRSLIQHFLRLIVAGTMEPPSLIPVMVKDYLSSGLRRTLKTARYSLSDPIETKLPQVKVPALVVRGSKDPIVSQDWAEKAARLLLLGSLAVIPGGGHALNWSCAEPLCEVVKTFTGKRLKVLEQV